MGILVVQGSIKGNSGADQLMPAGIISYTNFNDNTPNSDSSFRFKPVIKTPDLTKPAKAITLEIKPVDYYEFEELILQMVCEAVGLLVRTDYELSYKSEKGVGAGTILEDFEEFIKEYYRIKRHLILDDGEESISEENEITPPSKQKKKTSVPKESNLDEIDLMKGEINSKKSMDVMSIK
ncbi:unnamed protein product [Rhizophagus irregularis]|nr:unnamed protein product [Rhizophagus irregularis]